MWSVDINNLKGIIHLALELKDRNSCYFLTMREYRLCSAENQRTLIF
jgi:hypothetical protein